MATSRDSVLQPLPVKAGATAVRTRPERVKSDRPIGQIIVVDDGYDLFLTMTIYPNFAWDDPAYFLEGDPEGRTFAELLVDVVATEVIEPWGGGKWHLEVFRSTAAEPEDWNGEM